MSSKRWGYGNNLYEVIPMPGLAIMGIFLGIVFILIPSAFFKSLGALFLLFGIMATIIRATGLDNL
jgi:hypothetical protein